MGFTADRRVHLSAFGDSALWAVAMIGASAPLRLVDGACRRSDGKVVVVVRDLEHHLFVLFAGHLLGQGAGFLGSPTPVFWIAEKWDIGHGSGPFLGPTL